jgi:hypothetical protein
MLSREAQLLLAGAAGIGLLALEPLGMAGSSGGLQRLGLQVTCALVTGMLDGKQVGMHQVMVTVDLNYTIHPKDW